MDALVVDFSDAPMRHKVLAFESCDYDDELSKGLKGFNEDESASIAELAELDGKVAGLAAKAVAKSLATAGLKAADIQAISFAGQTIGHNPSEGWTAQCGDPNILAEESGIKVVADIRRRDVAAGGQGAPLACSFHSDFLSSADEARGIINLGGISNITVLVPGRVPSGFDIGPAGCLLDDWVMLKKGLKYDNKGKWAASGEVINDLLTSFIGDAYFSQSPPKTSGRDYFNLAWVENYLSGLDGDYKDEDVQASLVDLVALSISLAVSSQDIADSEFLRGKGLSLYFAGGGTRNEFLMRRIKHLVKCQVYNISHLGVAEKELEPLAFAWLAYLRMKGRSGNLPSITGARGQRLLGAIYD